MTELDGTLSSRSAQLQRPCALCYTKCFLTDRIVCFSLPQNGSLLLLKEKPLTFFNLGSLGRFETEIKPTFAKLCYAKSLQSCLTLWDPIDGSPLGSPVPGILQARTLEWVAISFFNAWKWKVKVKSFSCVRLFAKLRSSKFTNSAIKSSICPLFDLQLPRTSSQIAARVCFLSSR